MYLLLSFRRFLGQRSRFLYCAFAVLVLYLCLLWKNILAALAYPEILIAPIMSLGSFVAGATFLGGGAVAFPALTKILGTDPQTAKSFSFAIQSVGMSSASLYILSRISVIPLKFLLIYICGAIAGLIFSSHTFQGMLSRSDIRISFTLFVLCFLFVYLWTHKNISIHPEYKNTAGPFDHHSIVLTPANIIVCILCSFIGGAISGLLGSGADLLAFCLLTLFFRIEIKLATQLSVIVMATLSIVGVLTELVLHGPLPDEVVNLWLLAAPIVLFGAPLGAAFCRRTTSTKLIIFIVSIVLIEVVSTILLIDIAAERYMYYLASFTCALLLLMSLSRFSPRVGKP